MDAFAFDQMFARYVRQVNTDAVSRGTELYEQGVVRVLTVGKQQIRGIVTETRQGAFEVSLSLNDEDGLSGSCTCEAFFNCAHSYALARAARERIMGSQLAKPRPETAVKSTGAPKCSFSIRLGRSLSSEEKRVVAELERAFRLARQCGWILYAKDLRELAANRSDLVPFGREPLRELKRVLGNESPPDPVAFADLLKGFFEYKRIACQPAFAAIAKSTSGPTLAAGASRGEGNGNSHWDRPALRLKYAFELEPANESGWFQARARLDIDGGGFSSQEIDRLRRAAGQLVKLGERGWFRLDLGVDPVGSEAARILGLDPERGNTQRIHLTQVEDLIPEACLESGYAGALRDGIDKVRNLEEAEIPTELDGVLRPYQLDGFRFLSRLTQLGLGGILADDMGLGKTLQTLAWFLWLAKRKEREGNFRALVVCPKSVADNWIHEPAKFGLPLSATSFRGSEASDAALSEANVVVANYSQLRLASDWFLSQDWDVAVLDEAQYIKTPSSQVTRVAWKLKAGNRVALTGTPIENRLLDLWSVMRFAMPRLLGPEAAFRANYDQSSDPRVLEGLKRRVRPFLLRRLKREVARDLPERIEEDIYCELDEKSREVYELEREKARDALRGATGGKAAFNVLQSLLRMRQVCCDIRLLDTNLDRRDEDVSPKVQALLDLLEPLVEEGHKVLVFSQFVSMLEIISGVLRERRIGHLSLTGATKDRGKLVKRFQEQADESVFLLSLKAAGSGLNLTAASYVVLFDPWWNPSVEAQAIDRAHRIGQKNTVIAYRILAKDTVEARIRQIQHRKAEIANAIVGEESLAAVLGLSELRELLGDV